MRSPIEGHLGASTAGSVRPRAKTGGGGGGRAHAGGGETLTTHLMVCMLDRRKLLANDNVSDCVGVYSCQSRHVSWHTKLCCLGGGWAACKAARPVRVCSASAEHRVSKCVMQSCKVEIALILHGFETRRDAGEVVVCAPGQAACARARAAVQPIEHTSRCRTSPAKEHVA